ncbi:MAG: hypothetical protein Q7S55_05480 [Nanoarchaeota archaeon]|nr:hypothetical protein [Nanoarchaeota archaeon]
MRNYLANAIVNLHAQGLPLEHPQYNAAMLRKNLDSVRAVISTYDQRFVLGELQGHPALPEGIRNHFSQLEDTTRFNHGEAIYRLGIIDTGLRSDRHKPSGENLEALALVGMIVEENPREGMNLGSACCLTMVDEAGILTSSKFIGSNLAIINVFYPHGSANGAYSYDPSNIERSKAELKRAQEAISPKLDETLAELGLGKITDFSFETILKAIQRQRNGINS